MKRAGRRLHDSRRTRSQALKPPSVMGQKASRAVFDHSIGVLLVSAVTIVSRRPCILGQRRRHVP